MEQIYPEPTAGAIIFNPEGKVLLVKSPKWPNCYTIAGGHIELGETAEHALKREIKEELGIDIYDIKYVMTQEFIFDSVFYKKKHFIFLDFAAKTDDTDIKVDNNEITEHIWVTPEEALRVAETYTKNIVKEWMKLKKENKI